MIFMSITIFREKFKITKTFLLYDSRESEVHFLFEFLSLNTANTELYNNQSTASN